MIYIYSYAAMHVLSNTSPSCRSAMPVSNTSGGGSTGAAPSSEALEAGTKASGWRKAGMVWFMMKQNLVGGLEHGFYMFLFFPYIGNVIIPSDFHIFQRGRYATNQIYISNFYLGSPRPRTWWTSRDESRPREALSGKHGSHFYPQSSMNHHESPLLTTNNH